MSPRFCQLRSIAALLVGLAFVRETRAEDTVSVKYQDYRETGGRISVRVSSVLFAKDLGAAMQLKVGGVVDTIVGATPNGLPPATPDGPVPLSTLAEERKAWNAEFARQWSRVKIALGAAQSRESDYVSTGWSVNTLTDFNEKNTNLTLGVAQLDDEVKVAFQTDWMEKRTLDFIVGVTQLVDPLTSVSFYLTHSRADGYLSDPYKLVQKRVEVFPGLFLRRSFGENRPDSRIKWIALAALNRSFPSFNGALDASYRYHRDDFGVRSHMVNLEWFQQVGARLLLRPSFRYFVQDAADFYFLTLTGTNVTPNDQPTGQTPFYSADYRLSALETLTYGLKAIWSMTDAWQFDAAIERYVMRGRDGVTSPYAYPDANIVTVGIKFTF